jgi:hypothetical protein
LIVCGDFNGGDDCGALSFLENGCIDESFYEDGEPVTSSRKELPLKSGLLDAMKSVENRVPPSTLVVPELISIMVDGAAYENPKLSMEIIERLTRIFHRRASEIINLESNHEPAMNVNDVEQYLKLINKELGRGSEFREAARQMGWIPGTSASKNDGIVDVDLGNEDESEPQQRISLPPEGVLTLNGFIQIYESELQSGKFWGIAHDLALLGEPLPNIGIFQARFDRIYHSGALKTSVVIDFSSTNPCPNENKPSDHLPVAAAFVKF